MPTRNTRRTTAMDTTPPLSKSPEDVADPVRGSVEAAADVQISPLSENARVDEVIQYEEEDYDENNDVETKEDHEDEDYLGAELKPVTSKDKRKFGGSSKGRRCDRWTPAQEQAAVEGMLAIHAEGEIVGDKSFEELHNRLIKKDPTWNRTTSGIHNAWYRRGLARRVDREEARARKRQELQEQMEDEELGLVGNGKRKRSHASSIKLLAPRATPRRPKDDDPDSWTDISKAKGSSPDLLPLRPIASSTTAFPRPPIILSVQRPRPNFPTVTVSFKHHANNTRRDRPFDYVDDMMKLWSQALAAQVFADVSREYMMLAVTIGSSRTVLLMVPGDHYDYRNFVEQVERAVLAVGREEKVLVHIKAAGVRV